MPTSLITRLRASKDLRSAGRALALLFLLTGILGAFASGASAAAIENGAGAVHCLSVLPADGNGDEGALSCCTLGCPMVTAALPAPSSAALAAPNEPIVGGAAHPVLAEPPAILAAGESPRGPPAA